MRREKRAEPACYNSAMTAKQALLELIETMSEEEAEEVLVQLREDPVDYDPLTPEEEAQLAESRAAVAAGDTVSADEHFRRLNV